MVFNYILSIIEMTIIRCYPDLPRTAKSLFLHIIFPSFFLAFVPKRYPYTSFHLFEDNGYLTDKVWSIVYIRTMSELI